MMDITEYRTLRGSVVFIKGVNINPPPEREGVDCPRSEINYK
jgi:hypothetical protein